jgi:hypothetical protein
MYDCPRHLYRCPDGEVRIFANREGKRWRDPLLCWKVNTDDFSLSEPRKVVDTREEGLSFSQPTVDMSKLCPNQGRRQLVVFRCISMRQTAAPAGGPPLSAEEHEAAGVHCAEIIYGGDVEEPWSF